MWRQRMRAAAKAVKQNAHKIAVQGHEHARQAGRKIARKVISIQQAARLPGKLMRNSSLAVTMREMTRASDVAWQDGYRQVAENRVPGLAPREHEGSYTRYATGTWDWQPQSAPAGAEPDPEIGQ
jgi:hypothetical protein